MSTPKTPVPSLAHAGGGTGSSAAGGPPVLPAARQQDARVSRPRLLPAAPSPAPPAGGGAAPDRPERATEGEARPGRSWTLELPPGTPILTANHRLNRYVAQAQINALQAVAIQLARTHRLPPIGYAEVLAEYNPPPRRRKDRHPLASERIEDSDNLQPTAKALVDGLRKAGVWPSDSRKWVRHVVCEVLPQTHPRGQVRLTITEVGRP